MYSLLERSIIYNFNCILYVKNVSNYFSRVSKTYNWTKFKNVARLEKKYDDTLTEYFRSFYAMCKRLCGQPLTEEEGNLVTIKN